MIKKSRRPAQEINSSSMADIAFLLLVFFLVTTTISMDKGISLVLPSEGNELEVNKKNIVNILINDKNFLFNKIILEKSKRRVLDTLVEFHSKNPYKKSILRDELINLLGFGKKWFEKIIRNQKTP